MPEGAKKLAIEAFTHLANAEASIHGKTFDSVHFHEVGAIDAIADICTACSAFYELNIDTSISSPVAVGSGTMKMAHGILPIPAPATSLLLQDIPILTGPAKFELTTPTGAALIKTFCSDFSGEFTGSIKKIAYGAGKKTFSSHANVLKVMLMENNESPQSDLVTVLTSNIDDMNPEILAHVFEKIMHEGALDICLTPIQMKKSRAATQIQVICKSPDSEKFAKIILQETSSFGLRIREEKRIVLERKFEKISSPWGELKIKLGLLEGKVIKASVEFEDMKAISDEYKIAIIDVDRKCQSLCQSYLENL
jgi:pyridinium-3,5-bisthiocarboxylic acid mononucleotide nickel chelatase